MTESTVAHTGLLASLENAPTERALTVGEALQLINIVNTNAYQMAKLNKRVEALEALELPCQAVETEPTTEEIIPTLTLFMGLPTIIRTTAH